MKNVTKSIIDKTKLIVLLFAIFVINACNSIEESSIWEINLSNRYPPQNIVVQDIVNIDYIKVETDSSFLVSSDEAEYISNQYVGFFDNRTGDILFFFSQTGEKAFGINRRGNGPDEYYLIGAITLDEMAQEVYVWSIMDKSIKVYDKSGIYLRTLPLRQTKDEKNVYITSLINFNDKFLLCSSNHIIGYEEDKMNYFESFYLLDKNRSEESILLDSIPSSNIVNIYLQGYNDNQLISVSPAVCPIAISNQEIILNSCSTDTIYKMRANQTKLPFIIRHPSVKNQSPQKILRFDGETSDWIFLTSIELSYNFEERMGLKEVHLGISKLDRQIYEVHFVSEEDREIEYVSLCRGGFFMDAYKLIKAYERGSLSGRLKYICSELKEDENGVLVLMNQK